jgi:GT2 family glycosyltransferase
MADYSHAGVNALERGAEARKDGVTRRTMKLSVVILCWNDLKVINDCLASIFATTRRTEFEVIVPDNGSTDGSIEFIRKQYPEVRVIENGANLRFAKGNNAGIRASEGEYVLILNPDTIIHEGALDGLVAFADQHPEAGAFGCRVLNADGTYQGCIWPFPTPRSEWILALGLGNLGYISEWFHKGAYVRWKGETERAVGYPAGCCLLVRNDLLKRLGGFDEQFFYYYEETDLCRRIWDAGYAVLYTPSVSITHLVGGSTSKKFPPIGFAIDRQITRYLYLYKHHGAQGARSSRRSTVMGLAIRRIGAWLSQIRKPSEAGAKKAEFLRILFEWNYRVDPVRLAQTGEEPELSVKLANRVLER